MVPSTLQVPWPIFVFISDVLAGTSQTNLLGAKLSIHKYFLQRMVQAIMPLMISSYTFFSLIFLFFLIIIPKKFALQYHNHPPPARVNLDSDIRQAIKSQASHGKTCAQIEKVLFAFLSSSISYSLTYLVGFN
jgi:hypothetical protein